jgi:radical SAM superfamily enzyme YgiQ (UPF0313 family)
MRNHSKIKIYPVLVSRRDDSGLFADGASVPIGCLVSYAKVYKEGLLKEHFEFDRLVNRCQDDWIYYSTEAELAPPGVWLFSSYMWNHKDNMDIAKAIKAKSPDSLVIVGGPHIPAYHQQSHDFLQQHGFIDIAVRGEGEVTLSEILEAVASSKSGLIDVDFGHINGITFRRGNDLVRTADRVRNRNLDIFPSPYLTGEFDDKSFIELPGMVLETNRGCPFGCTFCDWGSATLQKFSLFDLERVKKEIDIIGEKKSQSIYLCDSNFGAFERDVEIARTIAETKKKYGFPKKFGSSFAKNASPRLAEIMKILTSANLMDCGLISIQTTDVNTLSAINRSNIKNDKYDKLIDIFKREGLRLSSELLIGLPGQTVQSHKEDLQFFIDRKLMTIAYNTAVMPNAPMNEPEYRKKYQIVTDDNDYVISTSTFTEEQYHEMFKLFLAFQFFYVLSVLKYYLYFLQMEHSIRFMDFIHDLVKTSQSNKERYPLNHRLITELLEKTDPKRVGMPILQWRTEDADFIFNHLDEYYGEIIDFTKSTYGLSLSDSEVQTLIAVQKAVMPAIGKSVPMSVELKHDFVSYFDQIKNIKVVDRTPVDFMPLRSFADGTLIVKTLKKRVIDNLTLMRLDQHKTTDWELKSVLRF